MKTQARGNKVKIPLRQLATASTSSCEGVIFPGSKFVSSWGVPLSPATSPKLGVAIGRRRIDKAPKFFLFSPLYGIEKYQNDQYR
jgi:hypothetical protein